MLIVRTPNTVPCGAPSWSPSSAAAYRGGTSSTPTYTYATWNPLDKSGVINLSNGDLDATMNGAGWVSVRATIGHTATDEYYEMLCADIPAVSYLEAGVGTAAATLVGYCGGDAYGWGCMSHGYSASGGVTTPDTLTLVTGDRFGLHIKRSTNQLLVYKIPSGSSTPTLMKTFDISSVAGVALYPMASLYGGNPILRANFGATTFQTATPPAIGVRQ